ncbi:MAG: hypothetical protein ABS75_30745 [Pelagibacterium sp. SCN 63-23]|nr:MAG: hypothetical protein ABS75_30745 [Pelagibacterium sp. SCN 63-23]
MAENRLRYAWRNRGLDGHKIIRQFPVGPFIVDFACRDAALVVELDGGQHAESDADAKRRAVLNAAGYSVLRFWNNEVLSQRDAVLSAILRVIAGAPSPDLRFAPATLSPRGRGTRGARAAGGARYLREMRATLAPLRETDEGRTRL